MNPQNRTPAEQPSPAVTPVTLKAEIAVSTRFGCSFRFGCHLCASHPDMPSVEIDAGPFVFRSYPAPDQIRAMAAQLLKLADAADAAVAVRS